jgi:hypothetical protein
MRHLVVLLLIMYCTAVSADDTDERGALARRLVELTEVKERNLEANQCTKVSADSSKAIVALYVRNPANFNGISPQSAYWPEVEAIYRDFYSVVCTSSLFSNLEGLHAKAYATMSLADLRAAVAFYSSPAAREMALAAKNHLAEANAINNRVSSSEELTRARASFTDGMRHLAKKYKTDPR